MCVCVCTCLFTHVSLHVEAKHQPRLSSSGTIRFIFEMGSLTGQNWPSGSLDGPLAKNAPTPQPLVLYKCTLSHMCAT